MIEIKLRERDLIPRDYAMMEDHIKLKGRSKKDLELWNLNVEKLKLEIISLVPDRKLRTSELLLLNVWEYDQNGSLLERSEVVQ